MPIKVRLTEEQKVENEKLSLELNKESQDISEEPKVPQESKDEQAK